SRGMYYRTLIALAPHTAIARVREPLDRAFPGRRILDYRSPDPQVTWFMDRASAALGAIGLLVLILAVLGAAISMWAHLERRLDSMAAMRAVGGNSRSIASVLIVQMAMLAAAGCALGIAGAIGVERAAAVAIPGLLHLSIPTAWNWVAPAACALIGFAAAIVIPLPVLLRAMRVHPSRILRRYMTESERASVGYRRIARWPFAIRHGALNLLRPGSHATVL